MANVTHNVTHKMLRQESGGSIRVRKKMEVSGNSFSAPSYRRHFIHAYHATVTPAARMPERIASTP